MHVFSVWCLFGWCLGFYLALCAADLSKQSNALIKIGHSAFPVLKLVSEDLTQILSNKFTCTASA